MTLNHCMTLNHSKTIKIHLPTMHTEWNAQQDIKFYCDLMSCSDSMLCTTSACFSPFFWSTTVPTLVENLFFNALVILRLHCKWFYTADLIDQITI